MAPCRPCRLAVRWFPPRSTATVRPARPRSAKRAAWRKPAVVQPQRHRNRHQHAAIRHQRYLRPRERQCADHGGRQHRQWRRHVREDRHERFRHGIVPCGDFRRDGVDPRDRRDWPLPRVQPLSQRSGRLRPSGQGDIMKTIVLALSLSLAAFSATAQTNSASSSTTSATSGATNAGNTQGITFNSKSDASGTCARRPPWVGRASTARSLRTAAWCRRAGAARSSASA